MTYLMIHFQYFPHGYVPKSRHICYKMTMKY